MKRTHLTKSHANASTEPSHFSSSCVRMGTAIAARLPAVKYRGRDLLGQFEGFPDGGKGSVAGRSKARKLATSACVFYLKKAINFVSKCGGIEPCFKPRGSVKRKCDLFLSLVNLLQSLPN